MPGTGTIINVLAIIAGGFAGVRAGRLVSQKIRESLILCCGVCTLFIGISGALEKMLTVTPEGLSAQGSMMMILTLCAGTLIGELLKLDERLEQFGEWLKLRTGNAKDPQFVGAFVTASLTVCIGAMAIVGSIRDAIELDPSILIAKAILDFIIVLIMSASLGRGAAFSAIPVGILQGGVTVIARFLSPVMTEKALSNLSLTGSVIIFCVGLNLVFDRRIRVANMLPALIFAALWAAGL